MSANKNQIKHKKNQPDAVRLRAELSERGMETMYIVYMANAICWVTTQQEQVILTIVKSERCYLSFYSTQFGWRYKIKSIAEKDLEIK